MRRLLLRYRKEGDAAYLSHRETVRAMEMALRRSGIPLVFSAGFSPRPRMSFSPALPLGVAAEAEYLEVAVEEGADLAGLEERMNGVLPQGLEVGGTQLLAPTMPKLSRWARYGLFRLEDAEGTAFLLLPLSGERQGRLKDALEAFAAAVRPLSRHAGVTRMGLYASPHEVFEDAAGSVFFYDGASGEVKEMRDEEWP